MIDLSRARLPMKLVAGLIGLFPLGLIIASLTTEPMLDLQEFTFGIGILILYATFDLLLLAPLLYLQRHRRRQAYCWAGAVTLPIAVSALVYLERAYYVPVPALFGVFLLLARWGVWIGGPKIYYTLWGVYSSWCLFVIWYY